MSFPITAIDTTNKTITYQRGTGSDGVLKDIVAGVSILVDGYTASHAEGKCTFAMGYDSHAEGWGSTAFGGASHAEGQFTCAIGCSSHAEGVGTKAQNYASHTSGKYNVGTATDTIVEVGIGASDTARANALEIYIDGRVIAPSLSTISDPKSLVTKEYADSIVPEDILVLSTLPTAGLAYFKKICYAIDTGTVNICVSNTETPAADSDCFWVQI